MISVFSLGLSLAVSEVAFVGLTSGSYNEVITPLFGVLIMAGVLSGAS